MFQEDFANDLANWQPEGPHLVQIDAGRLHVKTVKDDRNNGQYVWCRRELPKDFRIEWDVTPVSSSGFFLVFFCARGVKGEDILGPELFEKYMHWKTWGPYEDFDKYVSSPTRKEHHRSRIRCYHVSYRRNENANCNFRKNPGLLLLTSRRIDAVLPKGKTVHVALTKQGGRIRLVVDGRTFMDHTDPGDVHEGGRFGFRNVYDSEGYYDNVRVFDLTPRP